MATAKTQAVRSFGTVLQAAPRVYLTAVPGRWLLAHSTPSWRARKPVKGFQRIVKKDRAKQIARHVIDAGRPFPNAITLATDVNSFKEDGCQIVFPRTSKFLVVDGQHRLWAQQFASLEATYPCVIHMNRSEAQMAELFLEINDNQRRVPSSLRWDLYRLVRNDDHSLVATSDIVYALTLRQDSPFFSAGMTPLDRTGEEKELTIKQGSLAPEIKRIVSHHVLKKDSSMTTDDCVDLLIRFFAAVKSLDPDGWGDPDSPFFKARVLRAMLRVLDDLLGTADAEDLTASVIRSHLANIDRDSLTPEAVKAVQGAVGVQNLYLEMRKQVLQAQ